MSAVPTGRVVSLQVGTPAALHWRGKTVRTAIAKHAVDGPVALGLDGFGGDQQGDLRFHGGPDKAVCAYPVEHVPEWEHRLGLALAPGAFGENLTLAGLPEDRTHIGDVFELGTATVAVSQPRSPCYKLAARWGLKELPGPMARAAKSGYYLRVLEPGRVVAGDELRLLERPTALSVTEVMRVTFRDRDDAAARRAVLDTAELSEDWRGLLAKA